MDNTNPEKKSNQHEIKIKGVPVNTKVQLKNIAAHKGVNVSSLLKPVILDFIESHSKDVRFPPPDTDQ